MSAFIYAINRLPVCIMQSRRILLGQSAWTFANEGIDVESWQKVSAPGRRRHWYYDGQETLAAYIASSSDLDDLIPTLVAYQIEWNKFQDLFHTARAARALSNSWRTKPLPTPQPRSSDSDNVARFHRTTGCG